MINRPNKGYLYPNEQYKHEGHPNVRGKINVCCPDCGATTAMEIGGWYKKDRNKIEFTSLSIREAVEEQPQGRAPDPYSPIDR
jgi:hypothetical protein